MSIIGEMMDLLLLGKMNMRDNRHEGRVLL
jgi:hypothetical protein